MLFSRLTAVKSGGRKSLFGQDNIFAFAFIAMLVAFALLLSYKVFAYFTLGILVVRIFEVIFEMKGNLLDRPFLNYLILFGLPLQFLYEYFLK